MSDTTRFFKIMMAFQAFGGKELRVLNSTEVVTDRELDTMEFALQKVATKLRADPRKDEFHACEKLADQIEAQVGKLMIQLIYPEERQVTQEWVAQQYADAVENGEIAPMFLGARDIQQMCSALEDAGLITVRMMR